MKVGVVVFPGSNCDHDAWYADQPEPAAAPSRIHLARFDRSSATSTPSSFPAAFPTAITSAAAPSRASRPSCAPSKSSRPMADSSSASATDSRFWSKPDCSPAPCCAIADLKFVCREVTLRTETTRLALHLRRSEKGQLLRLPVAHGEGRYFADDTRSTNSKPKTASCSGIIDNPNGSLRDIAGILNRERNVMGMMPHPERACDPLMGSTEGLRDIRIHVRRRIPALYPMTITPELISQHQLTPAEYQKIVSLLGREPSYTELGVFSVMWSEHCSYKSSRIHLKKLPTQGKYVVQGPGENAGIIGIGGGWVVAVQDRVAQSPQLHRAVPGRRNRRRRHTARHLHHGRAPHRGHGFSPLRSPRGFPESPSTTAASSPASSAASRTMATASASRPSAANASSKNVTRRIRW